MSNQLKGTVEKPYIKFTLTIESNSLGSIVDLFDDSAIHETQVPSQTPAAPETPENLRDDFKEEIEQLEEEKSEVADPGITMGQLKHLAVQVSDRLGSKKVVGDTIKQHFGCKMPDLPLDQYAAAYKVLEDLNNA